MRRSGRVVPHATLLAAVVAFALYGVAMVAGYPTRLAAAVLGRFPVPKLSVAQVTLGC